MSIDQVIDAEIVAARDAQIIDADLREAARTADNAWSNVEQFVAEAEESQIHGDLGFASWPAYVADVVAKEMPTISVQVDQRRRVVEMLAAAGMSNRAIATAVGVSHPTVIRDRAAADQVVHDVPLDRPTIIVDRTVIESETGEVICEAPQPPLITGLNGKTYQPPRPKPQQPTEEQLIAHHEAEKLAAHQETFNRWSRAVDGLTNALSYAKTFEPPADMPGNYVSIEEFKTRLAALVEISNGWKETQ